VHGRRRSNAFAASASSETQTGSMLPIRKFGSLRRGCGTAASDCGMCDRLAFANTTPSAISAASATIFLRSAARMIGGNAPILSNDLTFSTKARISESGLPGVTPRR
jgi:hypothetical protein